MSKSIFKSKTFWINVAGLLTYVSSNVTGIPPSWTIVLTGIANIINRFFTDGPVHIL